MDLPVVFQGQRPTSEVALSSPLPGKIRALSLLTILALWGAIYVAGMYSPALMDDADSVHAEAAREMSLRHDWVTLYLDGLRYLEKAPLMYWGMASSYTLFGVSEWSARLPLVLGMLGLLFSTYVLGRRAYGEQGGLWSAVVLATSLGPYLFTRFLIPDTLVALWLTLTFLFFLRTLEEFPPSRLACWGMAVTVALNVLTKGLIGLVFPVAAIGMYLLLTGNLRHLLRLRLSSSTIIFVAVAAPWHVMAAIRNPDQGGIRGFLWFYFVNEHFLRYLNKRVPRDYDTVPLLVFWGLLLLWMFPWSAFLPQALRQIRIRWREFRRPLDARQRANLLCVLWIVVIVAFFSFSSRQEYYTIPALPGLALLIGGWLSREHEGWEPKARRGARVSSAVLFVIGIAVFICGMVPLFSSKAPAPGVELADLLRMKDPQSYTLSLGHIFDLTPQALGAFRSELLGVSVAMLCGTGANWWLRRRAKPSQGNIALAAMMVVLLFCVHSALVKFSPILSSKNLALAIQKYYRPGDLVVIDAEYEQGSTLNFYLGVSVRILHEPTANLYYGSLFPDAPHVFETEDSFLPLWAAPSRVFLWTEQEHPPQLRGASAYVLARSGGKLVLTNRPLYE